MGSTKIIEIIGYFCTVWVVTLQIALFKRDKISVCKLLKRRAYLSEQRIFPPDIFINSIQFILAMNEASKTDTSFKNHRLFGCAECT